MSEQELTKAVLDTLNKTGRCRVWRNQSGMVKAGKHFMHLAPKGSPDIVGFMRSNGKFIGIEVKLPNIVGVKKSVVSQDQAEWQEALAKAGTVSGIVTTVAEAMRLIVACDGPPTFVDHSKCGPMCKSLGYQG